MNYSIKKFGLEISKLIVVIILVVALQNIESIETILAPSKLIGFAMLFLLVFFLAAIEMRLLKSYVREKVGEEAQKNS